MIFVKKKLENKNSGTNNFVDHGNYVVQCKFQKYGESFSSKVDIVIIYVINLRLEPKKKTIS